MDIMLIKVCFALIIAHQDICIISKLLFCLNVSFLKVSQAIIDSICSFGGLGNLSGLGR